MGASSATAPSALGVPKTTSVQVELQVDTHGQLRRDGRGDVSRGIQPDAMKGRGQVGAVVHVAHPLGVKAFAYRRIKNDERDAADLANSTC